MQGALAYVQEKKSMRFLFFVAYVFVRSERDIRVCLSDTNIYTRSTACRCIYVRLGLHACCSHFHHRILRSVVDLKGNLCAQHFLFLFERL